MSTADAQATILRHTTVLDQVRIQSTTGGPITFLTFYYPGWTAYIDGVPTSIDLTGDLALMTVRVPPGEHTITLQLEDTWPRIVGTAITLLSAVGVIVYSVAGVLRRRLVA
ncbi:MAG: YfhO family protein, partial [Chloroflexi bacterium]|nr:YfhO family protein [Chloroflexota bacterium]